MCMGKWKQILNIFLYSMTFFHHICDENIKNEWRVDFIQARVEIIHQVSGNYPHVSGNYPKRVEKIEWNLSESSGFYPNRVEIIRIEWILSKMSGKNRVDFIQIEWILSKSSGNYPKWVEINFGRVEIIQSEWKLSKVSGRIILPFCTRLKIVYVCVLATFERLRSFGYFCRRLGRNLCQHFLKRIIKIGIHLKIETKFSPLLSHSLHFGAQ